MELLPRILSARLKIVTALVLIGFVSIALYLFHLQIQHMQLFFNLSQKNFLRQEKVACPRGNIIDINGTILATNRPVYTVYWQGTGEKHLTQTQQQLITTLISLFELPHSFMAQVRSSEHKCTRILVAADITFDQLTCLLEKFPHEKNIFLEKSYKRCYPYKDLACHIVGYLGLDPESTGKMGLELQCNKVLKGQSGKIIKIINSIGRHIDAHTVYSGLAGKTLQTTLDLELQQIAEEVFPQEYEGCCLSMDDQGGLEVLLSRPTFDPSMFLRSISEPEWHHLQEKKGFINRAFSACYPPASLFKLVTLSAALETGLILTSQRWHCIGHTEFKGRNYHCNNRSGHGIVSTEQALAHSCNIPFYDIGKRIKIDTLAEYANRLGLGVKTGLLLPEKTGLIPTRAWKKRVKKEAWWPGETLSAAIGQSSLLVTPIQVATMISALSTGYKVRPRILVEEPVVREPLDLDASVLSFLQQCLTSVIKQGTATHLKHLNNFKISGKTGTAQTCSLEKQTLAKRHLHHGYFVAHFQYKKEKPRTLMIFVEHAGSSLVALRIAQRFLTKFAHLMDKRTAHIPAAA